MSQPPRDPYARYRPQDYPPGQAQPVMQPPPPSFTANPNYVPPQQPGSPGWGPPPPPQPPKKKHRVRNVLLGLVGLFVILIAIGVAVGGSHNTASSTSVSSSPAASTPAKQAAAPSPSATQAVAFQPQTLLATSGSGDNTTARFSVGGSGDWDIYWTYSEGGFGQSVNFAIDADNGNDLNFNGPNQLGTGGSGVTHVYNDAGTHYLSVTSEGNWTIKVVTAP